MRQLNEMRFKDSSIH